MMIEVIEKKGKPVQTKISFTKKEWNSIPPGIQGEFVLLGVVETARKVYFMIDGDLLNNKDTNVSIKRAKEELLRHEVTE